MRLLRARQRSAPPLNCGVMRRVSVITLAFTACACTGSQQLGRSKEALELCFSAWPDSPVTAPQGEAQGLRYVDGLPANSLVLADTTGWRLIANQPVDPVDYPTNPYVSNGCFTANGCREYWFQKSTGDIRYCVTNGCWVASAGFGLSAEGWTQTEGNKYVCTEGLFYPAE